MAVSSDLFQLVQSLSKSEKRYFKMYVDLQKGEKNYMRLFDAMTVMKAYDEEQLIAQFEGESFVKDLHVTKNYLYQLVLKSMRAFHEQKSTEAKVFALMQEAAFLEQKGLYKPVWRLLKKANKLASGSELHYLRLEILNRQIRYLIATKTQGIHDDIEVVYRELNQAVNLLQDEVRLGGLNHRLFTRYRKERFAGKQEVIANLQSVMEDPKLAEEPAESTFRGKHFYYNIHAFYYQFTGELKRSNEFSQRLVDWWDAHPTIITEEQYQYKIVLSNHLNNCHMVRRYELFPALLAKIRALPCKSFDEEAEEFQNTYYLEVLYRMNTLAIDEGLALLPEIEAGFTRYEAKLVKAREIAFYYNLAVLHFAGEDFKGMLRWLNTILYEKKNEARTDLLYASRLLILIAHTELKHFDLLDDLISSTRRYLKSHEQLKPYQIAVLSAFKEIMEARAGDEQRQAYHSFVKSLEQTFEEIKVLPPSGEEMLLWAKSKAQSVAVIDLLR